MKIICIVGMPGAGKGTAVEVLREKGLPVVNMGDVVRREAEARGYEVTPTNLGNVSIGLRKEFGEEEIARRCVASIERELKSGSDVVIEGIRSLREVLYFKGRFRGDFYLIALHASPTVRFARLKARARGDDPRDWNEFEERDHRELGYGMGSAIALADYMVVNEGSIEELKRKIRDIYEGLP
jgi:dephospho-CoA kinase